VLNRWWPRRPAARVAINLRPTRHPWGGGNQWVQQIARHLRARGWAVHFRLDAPVDLIVLVDPRVGGPITFGVDEIEAFKRRHPRVRCLHRVNECDARKATDFMDKTLAEASKVVDFTVFVSDWLRQYHAARWFDVARPHAVIVNGADPRVFHPIGAERYTGDGAFRLVTHHWSDNWMKGFDVYGQVDELIARGKLPETELWVIGRWPKNVRWQAARTHPPVRPPQLGALLRKCHAYLTASRWEPGPMHPIEGAQCGLPVVYHEDGGGVVEVARRFGVPFRDDVGTAILDMRERYRELRSNVLAQAPSGDQMCLDYARVLSRLVIETTNGVVR
jgi:glycosyltransferase involved in cell wall biosynthesis